jgi:glutathionyl-hydroquinone reductase
MMCDLNIPNTTIEASMADLRAFVANPENIVPEYLRATWEPYRDNILTNLDIISENLQYHRTLGAQITNLYSLFRNNEPCYAALTTLIASAELEFHVQKANEFKESLVCREIGKIDSMILKPDTQLSDLMPIIEPLMSFIEEEKKLRYDGKDALSGLHHILKNFDLHKEIMIKQDELEQRISQILDTNLETDQLMGPKVVEGLEALRTLIKDFDSIYGSELKCLESRFNDCLKHNKHRRLMYTDPEYRQRVEDAVNNLQI